MIGIYKITNNINKKSYVGQSVHIERRWAEHKMPHACSAISSAIKKYGKENFDFMVLEECEIDQLDKREQYWIKYYNTITPNGYNIAEDTATTHTVYKATNKQMIVDIILDLKNTELSLKTLAEKYGLSVSTISRINDGKIHIQENEIYPIRKIHQAQIHYYCIDCGKLISKGSKRCSACEIKSRKNSFQLPISRDELKNKIRTLSFIQIGLQYRVTDNAIRKWCDKYNLPRKKSQIKAINDKDWEKI